MAEKIFVSGVYINSLGQTCTFKIIGQSVGGGGGASGVINQFMFSLECPDSSKNQQFPIRKDQINEFLNDVLNKGKNWILDGNVLPGIWRGEINEFFPSQSASETYNAGSSMILVGQQMARAKRNEMRLNPEVLKKLGFQNQTEIPRTALILPTVERQLAGEEQLLSALKDEPQNLRTKRTKLMFASYKGDVPMIIFLLTRANANVNLKDYRGQTALYFACLSEHLEAVKQLIKFGADMEVEDVADNITPLMQISYMGNVGIVTYLLEHGANVNHQNENGETALFYACHSEYDQVDIIRLLIQNGANTELTIGDHTPLMEAVEQQVLVNVRALLDGGANVNKRDEVGRTALYSSIVMGSIEIIRELLDRGADFEIPRTDSLHLTPLMRAVIDNDNRVDIVKELLERGANPNARSINLRVALHFAFNKAYPSVPSLEIVRLLIKVMADLNLVDSLGNTALLIACSNNNNFTEGVLELINAGADVNLANQQGETPLMKACKRNNIELVTLLLDRGANINSQNQGGDSAFIIAARGGHLDVVRALLDKGANINQMNNQGETSLLQASTNNESEEVDEELIKRGADINVRGERGETALFRACKRGNVDIFLALQNAGADVNIPNSNGRTPLIALVESNMDSENIIKTQILENGGNIDQADNNGTTPLFLAVLVNDIDLVRLLLEYGANIDKARVSGTTPLLQAVHNNNIDMVRFLLENGANKSIADSVGRTPLIVATGEEYYEIALLISNF